MVDFKMIEILEKWESNSFLYCMFAFSVSFGEEEALIYSKRYTVELRTQREKRSAITTAEIELITCKEKNEGNTNEVEKGIIQRKLAS